MENETEDPAEIWRSLDARQRKLLRTVENVELLLPPSYPIVRLAVLTIPGFGESRYRGLNDLGKRVAAYGRLHDAE